MADTMEEKVIMTPKCKTATSTTLVVERKAVHTEASDKIHVAGGDHTGIIINKEQVYAFIDDSVANQTPVISEQRVLDMIENAYPNPLTVEDFITAGPWSKAEVKDALEALEEKGLTRAMSEGLYIRQHSVDTQVVKQMPTLCSSRQPSIAIITALYCEKQAVDAMMDNQETFVRYTTVENGVTEPCHAQLEFRVYLVSGATGSHTREARALRFWFKPQAPPAERPHLAQAFFRELVSPHDFPKDYVGFIKKIIKLMQNKFQELKTLEIELRQEGSGTPPPAFIDDSVANQTPVISEQRVLDMIENAYPNPLTVEDFITAGPWSKAEVKDALEALEEKGLTRAMSEGLYIRQHSVDTQVVKQMPTLCSSRQPSIAIITALYCEKQAVDAMMDNQETFVRYTTVGESNVYTLGTIGAHRVVTTKLPSVGRTREAMTAAGNTTTRLLGIFQKVEYVFLVGVGGGVPHYTDYGRHVRLGDVVVSTPAPDLPDKSVYVFCEKAERNEKGGWDYEVKPYKPDSYLLQDIAARLVQSQAPWDSFVNEGLQRLRGVPGRWEAPAGGTDRLCVDVGHGAFIEVSHPAPQGDQPDRGGLRVHCAPVAGGRAVSCAGEARAAFAAHARARAYDCELDAVLDSVVGNRKDCFISIRGISDYRDGTRGKEWQPHAALAAAAVMKAVVAAMDPPAD